MDISAYSLCTGQRQRTLIVSSKDEKYILSYEQEEREREGGNVVGERKYIEKRGDLLFNACLKSCINSK